MHASSLSGKLIFTKVRARCAAVVFAGNEVGCLRATLKYFEFRRISSPKYFALCLLNPGGVFSDDFIMCPRTTGSRMSFVAHLDW